MDPLFLIHSIIALLIGMCFGSFVNVCIYRLPSNNQILIGHSFCRHCGNKIRWFDNFPLVSFVLLKGKCRYCKNKISLQYILVEILAGLGFLLIFLTQNHIHTKIFLATLLLLYLIIFFIDLKHFIIPDTLSFGIILLAFIKNFFPNLDSSFTQDVIQSVIGGLVGYFSIWIIIYLYKIFRNTEGMGLGDAKLMAGIGLLFGSQALPFVLFVAAVLGLLLHIPSLLHKKKNLQTEIPFGPYIIVAGIIYFMYGDSLYKLTLGV